MDKADGQVVKSGEQDTKIKDLNLSINSRMHGKLTESGKSNSPKTDQETN